MGQDLFKHRNASAASLSQIGAAAAAAASAALGRTPAEHPLGEYPSRTLFVRNINIHTTDEELLTLFSQCGEVRSMYTACKHRGFVMISYHDIRASTRAKQVLQVRLPPSRHAFPLLPHPTERQSQVLTACGACDGLRQLLLPLYTLPASP